MPLEQRLQLRLAIPAHEYLAYYRNEAGEVIARALDGRSVAFPASSLRPYVSHEGVYGMFEICFDGQNRLVRVTRLGD
ncbi:MAG: DUF2835 domain-containing protein [Gammaproteobacteria bacterium]|nr:DUF2835 domain-containing protein [Gammaproteobacteria bacterium]